MGEIVNLRRFRKARKRLAAAADADQARITFGRGARERQRSEAERELSDARLEGHRREPPVTAERSDD